MQRFKDFTKKSGKVASAILSAAMVTSMVAGTNVVYAANTEVTTEETDVTADAATKEEAKAIVAALEKLPVSAGTTTSSVIKADGKLTDDVVAFVNKEVEKSIDKADVTTNGAVAENAVSGCALTIKPEADKKGEAELTFEYKGYKTYAKYELASTKEREAALKAAIEEKIEKATFEDVKNKDAVNAVVSGVAFDVDKDTGLTKYKDLNTEVSYYGLTVNEPKADEAGSAKGKIIVDYFTDATKATKAGSIEVNVDKTLPSLKETVETAADNFGAYLDTVKYITSETNTDDFKAVVTKYAKDNSVTKDGEPKYVEKTSADDTDAGKAETEVTFKAGTVTKGAINTVVIPSDEQKVDLVFSDLTKYAKSASNASKDAFETDFVKAFNEDNTKVNTGNDAEDFDGLGDAVKGVYGNGVTATVEYTVEDGKTVAKIEVKFKDTKKKDTIELKAAQEAPKGQFVEKDGKKFYYDENGQLLQNTFLQGTDSPDGYTYYIQNDGSVMQDRLTYYPNSADVIYFDKDGHEVFDAFVNVKKDIQGNAVDYIGYFNTSGKAYTNVTTYGNGEGAYSKDALFYINDYGVLENKGWFKNAAGEIGYAAPNGTLTTSQWSLDQFGRKVYFQANGFLAKGLMTDGVKYYQLDETDGHLVGEF